MVLAWIAVALLGLAQADVPAGDPRRTPVVAAVQKATPAVVTVGVVVQASTPFAMFRPELRASEGSGVVIDPDGIVLTNAHVVDGAQAIQVHLHDGRTFDADVVAADRALDLAVLRLPDASGLPTLPLGDSGELLLGEPAIAIGNPFGLGLTVSTGVISSVARDVEVGDGPVQTYIQTDAAINPGNSGGALVNLHGELVGINTFIHSSAEGVGFAIPVNRARKIAADLLAYGQVQLPWVGIAASDRVVRRGRDAQGVVVVGRVVAGGPAEGRLRTGDVLLALDDHDLATRADLNARLAERVPGATVAFRVLRGDRTLVVEVPSARAPVDLGRRAVAQVLGVTLDVDRAGLVVVGADPSGAWARQGLRAGDRLVAVDGRRVRTLDELSAALTVARGRHRDRAWFLVARGAYQGTVELPL